MFKVTNCGAVKELKERRALIFGAAANILAFKRELRRVMRADGEGGCRSDEGKSIRRT
jgi:hypothetical protein